jgi:diaminopimelate epimerase
VEPGGQISVDMGAPELLGRSVAVIAGQRYEGLEVSLGNPHLACIVDTPVSGVDLSRPPATDPARFPDGANVEVLSVSHTGCLEMRVYERGSGATLSCGTGAVAAAVAAQTATAPVEHSTPGAASQLRRWGERHAIACSTAHRHPGGTDTSPVGAAVWIVHVPGGELVVTLGDGTSLLTGPAVIVAEGDVSEMWLQSARFQAAQDRS